MQLKLNLISIRKKLNGIKNDLIMIFNEFKQNPKLRWFQNDSKQNLKWLKIILVELKII